MSAFTKDYLYDPQDQLLSLFAKALSHPARILILRTLFLHGKTTVEDLRKNHPLSQPSISQHLRILRITGLVEFREVSPHTFYWIETKSFEAMKNSFRGMLGEFENV